LENLVVGNEVFFDESDESDESDEFEGWVGRKTGFWDESEGLAEGKEGFWDESDCLAKGRELLMAGINSSGAKKVGPLLVHRLTKPEPKNRIMPQIKTTQAQG
jgi:hypothetical protein